MLFNQEKFTLKNYRELPEFNYRNRVAHFIWQDVLVLLLINGIVLLVFGDRSLWKQNSKTFLE